MPDTIIGRRHPRVVKLWDELVAASSTVYLSTHIPGARRYRDGLLDAYAIITGDDVESVHEDLQAALTARAESRGDVL